jgi:low affinity Fe/Cu permease
MQRFFRRLAQATAQAVGTPWTFLGAVLVVIVWALSGPAFHFSDTWQLVINTGTTIVTFLMVFLIQNTQNRDAKVMHLKLDELIRATHTARNRLVDMEAMSDEELAALQREFRELHRRAGEALEERRQHDRRISPHRPLNAVDAEAQRSDIVSVPELVVPTSADDRRGDTSGEG